jgi:hypothetical protein
VKQDIDMGAIVFTKEQMLKESQNISSSSQLTKQETKGQDQDHLDLVNLCGLSFPDMLAPPLDPLQSQ